jgi:aminoacrylate hydrolase
MLRGLARNMKHWLGFDRVAAGNFQVITVDARGLGGSTRDMKFGDSIEDLADDVIGVLDEVGCEKAHFMGISLGGMVTLAAGIRHPDRTASLTVVNSSIAGSSVRRLSTPAIKSIFQAATLGPRGYLGLARTLLAPGADVDLCQKVAREWWNIDQKRQVSTSVVIKQLLAAARFRVREELQRLSVPVLVIFGEGDQFVPVENSHFIASLIPGARLVGLAGGGHEITLDCPDHVLAAVTDFIDGLSAKESTANTKRREKVDI